MYYYHYLYALVPIILVLIELIYIDNLMAASKVTSSLLKGGRTVWFQKSISLPAKKRGIHIITDVINGIQELSCISIGLAHVMIKHTSASLSLNECWDSEVRTDMETILNRLVPESASYEHSMEGPDDMPSHAKTSLMGASVTVPITDGKLNLGTWQGVWLNEHRDRAKNRTIVVTIQGMEKTES